MYYYLEKIYTLQRIETIGSFIEYSLANVRRSFFPVLSSFTEGFIIFTESFAEFITESDLLIIAFALSSTVLISKKAFGWFKGMTK